jgi:protein-S-isoprenylcysteine O-methyltransferase Ste14
MEPLETVTHRITRVAVALSVFALSLIAARFVESFKGVAPVAAGIMGFVVFMGGIALALWVNRQGRRHQ